MDLLSATNSPSLVGLLHDDGLLGDTDLPSLDGGRLDGLGDLGDEELSLGSNMGIGMLHAHSHAHHHSALSASSPDPLLPQSNSPLFSGLSGAPLIGSMPLIGDLLGGPSVHDTSPAKSAAVSRVHMELESLEQMKREIEADLLHAEMMKKKSTKKSRAKTQQTTTVKSENTKEATATTSSKRSSKKAAAAAAAAAAAQSATPAMTTTVLSAPCTPAIGPTAAATGAILNHASDRHVSQSHSFSTPATPAGPIASVGPVGPLPPGSGFQAAAILPAGILTSTDIVLLRQTMDSLSGLLSSHSKSNIMPRYLKLSLPEVQKEIAFLEGDLTRKRQKYAQMITSTGHVSHRKGAAAALAAAALGLEADAAAAAAAAASDSAPDTDPMPTATPATPTPATNTTTSAGNKRRKTILDPHVHHHRANPVNNDVTVSTPSKRAAPPARVLPSGKLSQPGVGRGNANPRAKFSPAATPDIGQVVCLCKQVYDGTPVGPAGGEMSTNTQFHAATDHTPHHNHNGESDMHAHSSHSDEYSSHTSMSSDFIGHTSMRAPDVSRDPGLAWPASEDMLMGDIGSLDTHHLHDTHHHHHMDTTDGGGSYSHEPSFASSNADSSAMHASTSSDHYDMSAVGASASSSGTATPPLPYLIPCQRCPRWFHPLCLNMSPLEALTPFICPKHRDAPVPPVRALTRPTTSRHERLLEREKAAESAPLAPSILTPGSAYYLPDADQPYPSLPEDADDTRDPRLFQALRDMMQVYHLSQHDVCISSNLSGGQAALSSMINARKIANIGRKQNQLRRWLWKFEEWQRARATHIAQVPTIPRPVVGAPVAPAAAPISSVNGLPLIAGSVVAGHTAEWPPRIAWKSYFEPLTPEEQEREQERRMQHEAHRAAQIASKALAKSQAAATAAQQQQVNATLVGALTGNGTDPLASTSFFSVPSALLPMAATHCPPTQPIGDGGMNNGLLPVVHPTPAVMDAMPRLRTVHHAPLKYAQSPEPEETHDAGPVSSTPTSGHKRKSGEFDAEESSPGAYSTLTWKQYAVGEKVDVRATPDNDAPWLSCTIRGIRPNALLVHFLRTPDTYDQWVLVPSRRVAAYGSQNAEKKRQASRAGWDLEEAARTAFKSYSRAERLATKDGITSGAPCWSGKRLTGAAAAAAQAAAARRKADGDDDSDSDSLLLVNADECGVCGKGGNLLCCDACPRSYHGACCDPPVKMRALAHNEDEWICMRCAAKKKRKMGQ